MNSLKTYATPIPRRYPPIGHADTIFQEIGKPAMSAHGNHHISFIKDEEIIKVHETDPRRTKIIKGKHHQVEVQYTTAGDPIVQQQGVRGCTAGSSCMVIMSHNKLPKNIDYLFYRNFGDTPDVIKDISDAGLSPIVRKAQNPPMPLVVLSSWLDEYGPGVLDVLDMNSIGSHSIVLDHIDLSKRIAQIRDPFHGWQITIPSQSLEKRILKARVQLVQVEKAVPREVLERPIRLDLGVIFKEP